jgi:hypothetical protein
VPNIIIERRYVALIKKALVGPVGGGGGTGITYLGPTHLRFAT